MKEFYFAFICLLLTFNIFAKTAIVLDFDTDIRDYENNAKMMTDMFRVELINSGKIDVISRENMNYAMDEIKMGMSDSFSQENVKTLGKMLNADYLVVGQVRALSNVGSSYQNIDNMFLDRMTKKVLGNDKIQVTIKMFDVETLKNLAATRAEMKNWTDFNRYVNKMVMELVHNMEKNNNATNRILNNMNNVDADMFTGVWTAEIAHDGIVDNYTLTFGDSHKIEVKVTSVNKKGVESMASGKGRYNWNDNEKILSITVNTMSGNIKHIKNVVWKTMVNPLDDETGFSCVVPINYNNKSQNMRCIFYQD